MSIESVLSIVFAFLGLIFGALFAIFTQKRYEKYTIAAENIASGFMLAVVFFDLLPNSFAQAKIFTVFLGLTAGIVIIMLISLISFDKVCTKLPKCDIMEGSINTNEQRLNPNYKNTNKKLLIRNLTTAFAVALHNIPEGIALGVLDGEKVLVSTAILIALHNLPEGMAMTFPLVKIGIKWHKILLFALVVGACTVLGWGIGVLVGNISVQVIGFMLAISSGAMLQIVFGDLMSNPQNKNSGNVTLIGLVLGMAIATLV